MRKFLVGFGVLCFVIVAILVVSYRSPPLPPPPPPPPPPTIVDHLCNFVRDEQRMDCVTVLAADSFMKPGAIVEYETPAKGPPRASLPVADLFGAGFSGHPSCLVPGVDATALQKALSQPQSISIPQMTYDVDRNLSIGADVQVPRLYGFTFKAGPKWSDVSKIELANDDAWAIQLDELSAANAYSSCKIVKSCSDYIAASHYRVVGTAIVAKGINYRVYNKRGDLISLEAAAKSDEFTASVGGSTDLTATNDSTIKSTGNRVVGVRLLPPSVFSGQQVCEAAIVFDPPEASSVVRIVGGGGRYSIGDLQTQSKPIGETASLSGTGTETSECDAGFERKTSSAAAEARVDNDGPGALRFTYSIQAEGGHYATVAGCVLGQIVGKTGHDTTATAEAEMTATIFIILRPDSPPPLRVSYEGIPDGSSIRLVDWRSQPLQVIRTETRNGERITHLEDMPSQLSGSGSASLATRGPGYYRLEARFNLSASVTGNINDSKKNSASIRVSLDQ